MGTTAEASVGASLAGSQATPLRQDAAVTMSSYDANVDRRVRGVRSQGGASEAAMLRWKPRAWVVAILLSQATPAFAQYGAPFGGTGIYTVPELANGALGAGAASTASQPYCGNTAVGRDGPRSQCPETPSAPAPHGRR